MRHTEKTAGRGFAQRIDLRRSKQSRRFYVGLLARPGKEDYGVLLAVNLVVGGFAYGLMAFLALGLLLFRVVGLAGSGVSGLLMGVVLVAVYALVGAAILAGGVALFCLMIIPIFELIVPRLPGTPPYRRPGMALGAAVACLTASPVWIAVHANQPTAAYGVAALWLWTAPFVVTLQAAGALAAPGDLATRRLSGLRFGVRELLFGTTGIAVLAAMLGSGSGVLNGVALLVGLGGGTHLATRRVTNRLLRWGLRRRFAQRRRERRAAPSRGGLA